MTITATTYDVGGVRLPRPFQTRRLGHVGINSTNPEALVAFYARRLGLRLSDPLDFRFIFGDAIADCGPSVAYFMRHGTEHHSWVIFPEGVWSWMSGLRADHPQLKTNQITWQVGSLREVVEGQRWLAARGRKIFRNGRDTPGSNWNVYPIDPEGHVNELYYGIEQIGWQGSAKPPALHTIRYQELPSLPHRSELAEVAAALDAGVDLLSGTPLREDEEERYDVGGVLLGRPFKVTKIGPVRLFVDDIDRALAFYRDDLGLQISEQMTWRGYRCVFLRTNTEHHSLALYETGLRAELDLRPDSTLFAMGFQLAEYRQLRDARAYLGEHGVAPFYLPQELSAGMEHNAFFRDPDGNVFQLYAAMEHVGWDGRVRSPAERRPIDNAHWPESIEPRSDTFLGETFLGPWG